MAGREPAAFYKYDLIDFYSDYWPTRENEPDAFDLFFSLRLAFTDLSEIDDFLNYHQASTFQNDSTAFSRYLNVVVLRKHATAFVYPEVKEVVMEWITLAKNAPMLVPTNAENPSSAMISQILTVDVSADEGPPSKNPPFPLYTISRQVMTMNFMLEELGLQEAYTSKTHVARLIHLAAGKKCPQNLDNSNIYKKLKSPFLKLEKDILSDLNFVMSHFENLSTDGSVGIQHIVSKIRKQIESFSQE